MSGPRPRVRKACDRCRMKKGKCDGHFPCNKCKGDDSICGYSRRRIDRNRVYTRSYVELMERQRSHLVTGVHEMYKRLQQADALPASVATATGEESDVHSILNLLGVVTEDFDTDPDCDHTSDPCIDTHQDQVDGKSTSGSIDSGHASGSEYAMSPVSDATSAISTQFTVKATDSTFSSEKLCDVAPAYGHRGPSLVQIPALQALQTPWKTSFDENFLGSLVMPTSVSRAKAAECALITEQTSSDQFQSHSTNTWCSSHDMTSPSARPSYCWPSTHIIKENLSMPVADGTRLPIIRHDSGTTTQADLEEEPPEMQWDGILDGPNTLPLYNGGLDGLYFPAWDPMESTYQAL
ncbi:Fluconazole resistance protein 1 [Oleoguttula sp. CCFEE 5521]